jgi:hypothetical protein
MVPVGLNAGVDLAFVELLDDMPRGHAAGNASHPLRFLAELGDTPREKKGEINAALAPAFETLLGNNLVVMDDR